MADEQRTKGIVLHSMRRAVLDVWGEGALADVARRVSPDTRAQTVDREASVMEWVPERFLVEWHQAAFDGPAKGDDAALCRVIDRRVDLGFGRIRKALLALVAPDGVIRRGAELWRHDHTHGSISLACDAESRVVSGLLTDHVFCEVPIARRALAETLRHIVQLSRGVKRATETHAMQGKGLFIEVRWEPR